MKSNSIADISNYSKLYSAQPEQLAGELKLKPANLYRFGMNNTLIKTIAKNINSIQ